MLTALYPRRGKVVEPITIKPGGRPQVSHSKFEMQLVVTSPKKLCDQNSVKPKSSEDYSTVGGGRGENVLRMTTDEFARLKAPRRLRGDTCEDNVECPGHRGL